MILNTASFWLPKHGSSDEEYEDAYYPRIEGEMEGVIFRFAMADGATTAMLSRQWADLLVESFSSLDCDGQEVESWLKKAHLTWDNWKDNYLHTRELDNRPVKWYEEPGLRDGAFSTFLGVLFSGSDEEVGGVWKAVAVGDTCLFHVRGSSLLSSFPLEKSAQFHSRQFLISSNPQRNNLLPNHLRYRKGEFQPGDCFFLMTDALACWFLSECESGAEPWNRLKAFNSRSYQPLFEQWIKALRGKNRIRNDDVTLLRIMAY